jgi:protein SCO1/2
LYGDAAATDAAEKSFKVYARKQPAQGKGGYTVDHSAGMYVFDKAGSPRLYLSYGEKSADIAHDLGRLM